MISRGTKTNFLVGIPTAFFSGMGVALGVMDDSVSSLVGVAISASLLPPACNSGMLCFMAAMPQKTEWTHTHDRIPDDQVFFREDEHIALAIVSMCLTVANIIFVALGAVFLFRIKEVMPVEKTEFWTDLKMARTMEYQGREIKEEGMQYCQVLEF